MASKRKLDEVTEDKKECCVCYGTENLLENDHPKEPCTHSMCNACKACMDQAKPEYHKCPICQRQARWSGSNEILLMDRFGANYVCTYTGVADVTHSHECLAKASRDGAAAMNLALKLAADYPEATDLYELGVLARKDKVPGVVASFAEFFKKKRALCYGDGFDHSSRAMVVTHTFATGADKQLWSSKRDVLMLNLGDECEQLICNGQCVKSSDPTPPDTVQIP